MDAIGVALVAIGGFLLYASVRGEHPWTLFQKTTGTYTPQPTMIGAPYTGTLVPTSQPGVNLPQGISLTGGASGSIHP